MSSSAGGSGTGTNSTNKYKPPPPRQATDAELKAANPFLSSTTPAALASVPTPAQAAPVGPPSQQTPVASASHSSGSVYRPPPGPPPAQRPAPTPSAPTPPLSHSATTPAFSPPPRPPVAPVQPAAAAGYPYPLQHSSTAPGPTAQPTVYGTYPSAYTVPQPVAPHLIAPRQPVPRTPIPTLDVNPYINHPAFNQPRTGPRKRVVYVGICYFGGRRPLKGCINDVSAMRTFLSQTYGFPAAAPDCLFLADSDPNPMFQPTRFNILCALQWLVFGAGQGDSLVFHYSGHGGQQATLDLGDEPDGLDETILPVDHLICGEILDNEMNDILVRGAPDGVKVTAIMDCCHSGSILDLMYVYEFGEAGRRAVGADAVNTAIGDQVKQNYGAPMGSGVGQPGFVQQPTPSTVVPRVTASLATFSGKAPKSPNTSVTCFSASTDSQESADTWLIGLPSGALSLAFISVLVEDPFGMTFAEVFWRLRRWLEENGKRQTVMLSTSAWRDLNEEAFAF